MIVIATLLYFAMQIAVFFLLLYYVGFIIITPIALVHLAYITIRDEFKNYLAYRAQLPGEDNDD